MADKTADKLMVTDFKLTQTIGVQTPIRDHQRNPR
jgi:hypothetical protein